MTKTVSLELTAIEKLRFKKKARLFVFKNELLIIIKNNVKKKYLGICNKRIKEVCNLFHLPRPLGRNAFREAIITHYVGVYTRFIYNYVKHCISFQKEYVHGSSTPPTQLFQTLFEKGCLFTQTIFQNTGCLLILYSIFLQRLTLSQNLLFLFFKKQNESEFFTFLETSLFEKGLLENTTF
ncbi:hypothetical protein CDIK_1099 [Cucumispora dikerogammari]|nr:hypothetical protein CDIK_1099 [Cucumispora dikerogammari]